MDPGPVGPGSCSRQSQNCTGGDLLLGELPCVQQASWLLCVHLAHVWMELGVFWMFLCIATDPTRSCCSLLAQRAKFESCDAVVQQLHDAAL